jgi:alpha-glucuronidase
MDYKSRILPHKVVFVLIVLLLAIVDVKGHNRPVYEDGYSMWLRYENVENNDLLEQYKDRLNSVVLSGSSETINVLKDELRIALSGLISEMPDFKKVPGEDGTLVIGTPKTSKLIASLGKKYLNNLRAVGDEGYLVTTKRVKGKKLIVISANTDIGLLYGTFHLLRLMQTRKSISNLNILEVPKVEFRIANHWDNLDRSVERGYAGLSIWDWEALPDEKSDRYKNYARFCSSIGINSVVINNVNANEQFISTEYLRKISVLANIFRPYGVKVFVAINFNSPQTLGNLKTADPLNQEVNKWWEHKVDEIYKFIPDLGGFLVKADSEGQPGPNTYGRTHADGANMLAKALKPHDGLVMWRAFVYGKKQKDRIREAYDEFKPFDGKFDDNVILQVKKGPLDFMPREPFSPLFGAMKHTNTMIEFQITQEYLGNEFHLLYKGGMYDEILQSDTYAEGKHTYVGEIISGEVYDYNHTGMAGVINPGMTENWTSHPFVQSSWYAFGRLAWNYDQDPWEIAEDWIAMTFSNEKDVKNNILEIMKISEEAGVNYREPLGLTHIGSATHYGPAPWSKRSKSFHRASKDGIGFDRSTSGSKAVSQYYEPLESRFNNVDSVPEDLLLWFHHVGWDHEMKSGNSLWEELVAHYYLGVEQVDLMQDLWNSLKGKIDQERFALVTSLLEVQIKDAVRWRNSCLLYFQNFSEEEIPKKYEQPAYELQYYMK